MLAQCFLPVYWVYKYITQYEGVILLPSMPAGQHAHIMSLSCEAAGASHFNF